MLVNVGGVESNVTVSAGEAALVCPLTVCVALMSLAPWPRAVPALGTVNVIVLLLATP